MTEATVQLGPYTGVSAISLQEKAASCRSWGVRAPFPAHPEIRSPERQAPGLRRQCDA